MSRGHGRIQRAILDYLAADPSGASGYTSVYRVTCAIFGVSSPTDSQRASVRRAARQLHRAGLIRVSERDWDLDGDHYYWRRSRYPVPGRGPEKVMIAELHVSRLLTPEEVAAQQAVFRELGII